MKVYRLSSADGNQKLKELKERLSENQIEELTDTKNAYIMRYENVAMLWDEKIYTEK